MCIWPKMTLWASRGKHTKLVFSISSPSSPSFCEVLKLSFQLWLYQSHLPHQTLPLFLISKNSTILHSAAQFRNPGIILPLHHTFYLHYVVKSYQFHLLKFYLFPSILIWNNITSARGYCNCPLTGVQWCFSHLHSALNTATRVPISKNKILNNTLLHL